MEKMKRNVEVKYLMDVAEVPIGGEKFILEKGGSGYILHQYHKDDWEEDLAQYTLDLIENKAKLQETLQQAVDLVKEKGGDTLYVETPTCLYTEADINNLILMGQEIMETFDYKHLKENYFDDDDFMDFEEY